jgi:hypothetical protein
MSTVKFPDRIAIFSYTTASHCLLPVLNRSLLIFNSGVAISASATDQPYLSFI